MGLSSVENDTSSSSAAAARRGSDDGVVDWSDGHEGQHPDLSKMCVINTATLQRIVPNCKPMPLDNDCFHGEVFLMIRTPDVDDAKETKPTLQEARDISSYMKGRLRRFEFQFRVKLKKVPTGPLFLGCELDQPVKIGRIAKGLSNVLLAMIRRINPGFHYSWGVSKHTSEKDIAEDCYEKTHLSFPVEASMDRIVISKPGEEPPKLGEELMETPESVKRRRRMGAGSIQWNTEDTYTMCLWSAYCDWIKWKCMNVVGVRPFNLGIVTGTQPICLSVYEVKNISNAEYKKKRPPHYRKDLDVYARLEFSNQAKTNGGLADEVLARHSLETDSEITSEGELYDPRLSDDSSHSGTAS